MPISQSDIKFRAPQRLTDFPDGGGLMTGDVIVDGQVNNVFSDISRIDRSAHDVSLREIFGHVGSSSDDLFTDAHTIIAKQAADPNVSISAFVLANAAWGTRAQAKAYLEAGVSTGGGQLAKTWKNSSGGNPRPGHGQFQVPNGSLDGFSSAVFAYDEGSGSIDEGDFYFYIAAVQPDQEEAGFDLITMSSDPPFLVTTGGYDLLVTQPVSGGLSRVYSCADFSAGAVEDDTDISLVSTKVAVGPDTTAVNPEVVGIDPGRLPEGGLMSQFATGDLVVIHNTDSDTMPNPVSADQTVALSRINLAAVRLEDQDGVVVPPDGVYTVDLAAGEITFDSGLDLSGYTQPLVAYHRIEHRDTITGVTDTSISINLGLSRDFGASSKASAAIYHGNLKARYTNLFDQQVWNNNWEDDVEDGEDPASATYDDITYPIELTNLGCQTHRWAIVFTGTTTFNVHNEDRGVVASGDTGTDLTVQNPLTGEDYFTLRAAGWGAGWINGNVLRFNTIAAAPHIWLNRTVIAAEAVQSDDQGQVEFRGDSG